MMQRLAAVGVRGPERLGVAGYAAAPGRASGAVKLPAVKALSVDGSGIRGLIPALLLQHRAAQTKRPIATPFDLIASTSTGGILALGLTKPRDNTVLLAGSSHSRALTAVRPDGKIALPSA
jgi:hypothetical protein